MTLGRSGSDVELVREDPGASAEVAPSGQDVLEAAAYHALPARGHGPGVLVVDGAEGLSDFARDACDRLARAGHVALSPALAGDAPGWIEAGAKHLLDDAATDGSRVAALGFGQGGAVLLGCGHAGERFGCVVDCEGLPELPEDGAASLLQVPTLLLFGAEDERADEARRLEQALPSARLRLLPGAGAGFLDPRRADRFHADAAAAAWDALLPFLGAAT